MRQTFLALTAGLLLAGQGFAQKPADDQPASKAAPQSTAMLPDFLTKLNLSDQQEQQIKQIIQKHNQKLEKVLGEFQQVHWQIVQFEASLSAANAVMGHEQKGKQESQPGNGEPASKEAASDSKQAKKARKADKAKARRSKGKAGIDINILGMRIAVLGPDGVVQEIDIEGNMPRQAAKNELVAAHAKELKMLWAKAHELHAQMVRIEADRMVAVESQLTEKQLAQLQKHAPVHASGSKAPGQK